MITQIGNLTLISLSTPPAYTKIFSTDMIVNDNTIFNKCHFGCYLIKPIYNCYIKDIPFYNQVHESYNHAPIVLTEIENRLIKFKKQHKMTFHKWIHKLWKQYD